MFDKLHSGVSYSAIDLEFSVNESMIFIYLLKFYLFLAALGLRCCAQAFSSCSEWGLLFIAVCGLLIVVASRCGALALGTQASVVAAHRPWSAQASVVVVCGL